MHGLGDSLHQRAIVADYMRRGHDVWLETPWPCVYHDLASQPRLHLIGKGSALRTQAKNAMRAQEAARYSGDEPPRGAEERRIWYTPADVLAAGSVLAAMCTRAGVADLDFRLPVPPEWLARALVWIDSWQPAKPLLLYRPLNERSEWTGCQARNPDHAAYAGLLAGIRERFFVVSIADFDDGKEWMVGVDIKPDVALHRGELDFETMAGLTRLAALVWTSPGFMVILAESVGTPSICIFGGYEDGRSFSGGAVYAPHLAIEPIKPCACFKHDCPCDKQIDLAQAARRLRAFLASPDVARRFASAA